MMKKVVNLKSLISVLLVILAVIISFTWATQTSAHPPRQEGEQPAFTGSVQSSADGSAAIASQETQLDAAYFGANGQLEGLEVTPAGLALAPGSSAGSYTSGTILSPLGFTTDIVPLWGADLPEGTNLRLETRLSSDGGASWSDWVENPEAFYPVRDDLHSGNLIWAGSGQVALQFKVTLHSDSPDFGPVLSSVTLVFSDTSQGPTDGEIAGQMAGVSAAAQVCPIQKPEVISRTTWGCPDGQSSPRRPPQYAPVTHIIIHQTETPNQPQPYSGYAGWVRSVWNFHANILRWGDVGYNYLIDPEGKIYEGRAGGDDVIGIHDTHNRGSMAIGFIGCYGNCDDPRLSVAQPGEAMLKSAEDLIAWKLQQKGIDPLSSAPYDGLANIPVVAGGRDVTWTTSPGENIYNRLPDLRSKVSERIKSCSNAQACQITGIIFGKESYSIGETINFTVRLANFQGLPLVGATVTATRTVSQTSAGALASTGFGFVDRAGEYDGTDPDADTPGLYTYTFTASDANQRFLPCSATASIEVKENGPVTATPTSTATPTATPTGTPPTVTVTPTPTPTPTPTTTPTAGTTIRVNPANLVIPICSAQGTAAVEVAAVTNLLAVQLQLRYNPGQAQVIDADPGRDGVQVTAGSIFSTGFVAQNTVDTTNGIISFAATLLGGTINGTAELIRVNWQPVAAGSAPLTLENVILVNNTGQSIPFTAQNGQLEVSPNCAGIGGVLTLQGRTHHSGIVVAASGGQQTQTQPDGSFTMPTADNLKFSFPGYLSAQADVQAFLAQNQSTTGQAVNLGSLTLLAGDLNADNRIDILDLASIARVYGSEDALADLNADGTVNILDLVLAAGNYGQQGPLTDWR
jgi:hypothetical protein